ncbi:MAG TPA: hypothetical protein VHV77_03650, partial [Pirellulales bacterium]|nr:hypothetical protein [Pirellulales bacterium]
TPTRWETALARSYADHLLDQYHARRVTLYLVQHRLYNQMEIGQQTKNGAQASLNHGNSYVERPLGTFVSQASL